MSIIIISVYCAKDIGSISNREARELLNLADSTVKRILKEIAEKELLIVEGENKTRRYLLNEKKISVSIHLQTITMKGSVTMPVLAQEKLYTIDDIYALPDGERAELIDGQIYMMSPPDRKHQTIARELFSIINSYIKSRGGSCEAFFAPFAVFLNKDDTNYVEPDISVICDKSKLTDKGCLGAPDWIIEIVSPGSRKTDYFTKLFKYRNSGVREYWIVDSDRERIIVYDFESEDTWEYTFSESVKVCIYDDLFINFSDIHELINS